MSELPKKPSKVAEIFKGIGIILLLHVLQIGLFIYLEIFDNEPELFPGGTVVLFAFGFIQWFYAIPAMIIAAFKHRYWMVLGMLIFAVITLILNMILFSSMGSFGP